MASEGGIDRSAVWMPVETIPAFTLEAPFTAFVSQILHRLGVKDAFRGLDRDYLDNLLFHPLQNVLQHVTGLVGRRGFSILALRATASIGPHTNSLHDYVGVSSAVSNYLEAIVLDGGEGIAEHFFRSKNADAPSLYDGLPAREWVWLKHAFERHASSKYFQSIADADAYAPGVGLAAMLSALKHLRGYMDVRCGRMHGYQYFSPSERISQTSLIRPDHEPTTESRIRGTLVRLVIPVPGSGD